MQRSGRRRAHAHGVHAAPAMIHSSHGCQADNVPHTTVHCWRGPSKPEAGLSELSGRLLWQGCRHLVLLGWRLLLLLALLLLLWRRRGWLLQQRR